MLPLEPGERITTIMPLPEDEASWEGLDVMFATTGGTVRRNKLSDFATVNRAGKIAMKLDEGEGDRRRRRSARETNDVLLTTPNGQCIRFPVDDVRVFKGRDLHGRARHQRWPRATGSSPCRSSRMSRRTPASAPPILKTRRAVAGEPRRRRGDVEDAGEEDAACALAHDRSFEEMARRSRSS